jgi:hypothetical protein
MQANRRATISNGKVVGLSECVEPQRVSLNEIPITTNEFEILRACGGDLQLAERIIVDIKNRIKNMEQDNDN